MADHRKQVPENVPGEFFVDSTCIDCDACRQIAPAVFGEAVETSFVKAQPFAIGKRRQALQALLSCPTGSIGCLGDDDVKAVMNDFPLVVEEPVFYCGYNSPKSYGGNSYFIRHTAGHWLIDAPKFVTPLVKQFELLGGISHIFLTHRDDVADADRYAEHFQYQRIIHRDELSSQPHAEIVLDGDGPWELTSDLPAISTPGHTQGHCVLLYRDRFLFTGDHLDWDRDGQQLAASEDYCWYSWAEQAESMKRLASYRFEWVLPGHGQKVCLSAGWLARRIGLVNTMVFTHLPSNVLLILVPLMPNVYWAIGLLLLRFSISQMDVPTRQAYTMAVVNPDERSAAAGVTAVARSVGASLSPLLATIFIGSAAMMSVPFFVAGGLKIVYDVLLYRAFASSEAQNKQEKEAR
jgi:glyoxylase-like metal-dependent hydrolase (beta-lactamase superfamily II)/ferredoxin